MKLLELQLLYCYRKADGHRRLQGSIDESLFSVEETRLLYSCLSMLWEKYQREPDWAEVRTLIYERTSDPDKKRRYRKVIRRIEDCPIGVDLAHDLVRKARQKATVRKVLQDEVLPFLDSPDPIPIEKIMEKLASLESLDVQEHYNYRNMERYHFNRDTACPTGISKLDDILWGGLYPGELGLISGAPEEGKTMTAVNFAIPTLVTGGKVYFFTLDETAEDIAKKFDIRILGTPASKLPSRPKLPKYVDNLFIIDKSGGCKIEDISSFIGRNGTPAVVIVDGGDLLIPPIKYKERRFQLGEIYTSFLRVSRAFKLPLWVTTQATVKSTQFMTKKLMDLSEAKLEKSSVASVIVFLVKVDEPRMLKLRVGKARRPPGSRTVIVQVNRDIQMMEGVE